MTNQSEYALAHDAHPVAFAVATLKQPVMQESKRGIRAEGTGNAGKVTEGVAFPYTAVATAKAARTLVVENMFSMSMDYRVLFFSFIYAIGRSA